MPKPENLKPFKKGYDERRSKTGRPKKLPQLDVLLAEVLGDTEEGKTHAQQILEALRRKAKSGDVKAAQLLLDRGYGKAKESLDITTNGENITQPKIQVEILTKKNDDKSGS